MIAPKFGRTLGAAALLSLLYTTTALSADDVPGTGTRPGTGKYLIVFTPRSCSVGYVQEHTRGTFRGITRTGTSVSSVRYLYPYPEVL